jgi:hypothetical protein
MRVRQFLIAGLVAAAAISWACGDNSVTGTGPGQGALEVHLKDHPFWFDSVAAVNVFVVRIDARLAEADSEECDVDSAEGSRGSEQFGDDNDGAEERHGFGEREWVTIATPDSVFDLLKLQNGVTAFLGAVVIDTGNFRALRLVIDPSRSSIVLKDGTVLAGDASPFARFPSGEHAGIKILLNRNIEVREHKKTIVVVDFDLEQSFVLRGTLFRSGLVFRPVLRGAVTERNE